MKKVLFLLFILFLLSGCAARRARVFLPQVSSPAAEGAGAHFYGTPFQVVNDTPFFCSLFVGGKNLGTITPGGLVYDQRHWHNLYSQMIPVAAVCYRDSDETEYVGAGGRVIAFNEYSPAEWTIRLSDIRTPDGRPLRPTTSVSANPTSRRIKLPREWWASSTSIQVVNNTTSDTAILVNGKSVAQIGTGGVDYIHAELVGGNISRPLIITITNRAGCTYTETVWVQKYTQWARQIIFGPQYCGWRGW